VLGSAAKTADNSAPLTIQPLALDASPDGTMPRLSVAGGRTMLSWVEGDAEKASLRYAERTASGWSAPRTAATGADWFMTPADLPTVMRLSNGALVAEWLESTDDATEAYDLLLSLSRDEGKTWSTPEAPHHDATKTQHGFAALFASPASPGGFGLVWLDGRQTAGKPEGQGSMSLRSAMFDASGRETADVLVDDRVCDCCPTSIAVTADGPIAAFRDRTNEEIRDIAVSRYANGAWTPSRVVHADNWRIDGCPVNGPAIAASGRTVVVAWFTGANDQGRAFAAFSRDAGATFGAPIRLDEAQTIGRVDVALLDDGSAVASWIEPANGRAEFRIRRVDATGTRGPAQLVAAVGQASGRTSGYPHIARAGSELLLAWTETRTTVKTASAKLP